MPGREPGGAGDAGGAGSATGTGRQVAAKRASAPVTGSIRTGDAPPEGSEGGEMTATRSDGRPSSNDAARPVRRVRASDVLGPRGIVQIEHEGEVYTLRLTRNNRLILTK